MDDIVGVDNADLPTSSAAPAEDAQQRGYAAQEEHHREDQQKQARGNDCERESERNCEAHGQHDGPPRDSGHAKFDMRHASFPFVCSRPEPTRFKCGVQRVWASAGNPKHEGSQRSAVVHGLCMVLQKSMHNRNFVLILTPGSGTWRNGYVELRPEPG